MKLDATRLRRTRTVVRDGRIIGDASDFDAFAGETTQRALTAGADTADDDIDFLEAHHRRLLSEEFTHFRGSERRTFLGAGEAESPRGRPRDGVAFLIGERNFRIVIGSMDMENSGGE